MRYFLFTGLTVLAVVAMQVSVPSAATANNVPAQWKTIVVGTQSESERLATVDLQRYITQVSKTIPVILNIDSWKAEPKPAIIIGTPSGNSLIENNLIEGKRLDSQGFYLADRLIDGSKVIIAAGSTPEGATNAIYGLLREAGFRFYLGSEAAPESLPSRLSAAEIVRNPAMKVRGVLPWYNFFNSPTTWDPIDHRAFVDQLIRMGANFVGFHTYDHEPFAGYKENGKFVWGGRLLNTGSPTWGTSPLPTDEFGFGTGKLYQDKYFGAASTINIKDNNEAIKAEQDIMRDALDYARKRGLHPCIGFELWGDPLNPTDRDVFLKRLNHVLDQYPSVEYIWVWQAETQGAQGYPDQYNMHILPYPLKSGSHLPLYGAARRSTFKRIVQEAKGQPPYFQDTGVGEAARANEGARLEQFAQLALHQFMRRQKSPKLVISGWGGEKRILSAEYYDGLDKLLPDSVVFSSLDYISPLPHVDSIYSQLPKERQRWPIPWLENDGDQWQPQPYVHILESTVRDAHKGGSQGILGIHWRTREIEENFGYLVSYAWNPKLTAEGFFKDLAKKCYSSEIADEMASIHSQLDSMGYRWVGGGGQGECAPFTWGPGTEEKAAQLQKIRDRAVELLPRAGKGTDRLQWLITNMDWVLQYRKAEAAAIEAKNLLSQASQNDPVKSAELANQALDILKKGNLANAMHSYARRLTTRGEYGVLATINTKAYVDWKNIWNDALQKSGKAAEDLNNEEWNPAPEIILPRLITSSEESSDLELSPIILGGEKAWIHYKSLNDTHWHTQPLQDDRGWVKHAIIDASNMKQPGIEFMFSFNSDPSAPASYGPVTVTVTPRMRISSGKTQIQSKDIKSQIELSFKKNPAVPVELVWNDIPGIDYYRVYRDGKPVVDTAVPMFPDNPETTTSEYKVQALRDGVSVAESPIARYTKRELHISDKFTVETKVNASGVLMRWPATKSPAVVSYTIKKTKTGSNESTVLGSIKAARGTIHTFRDVPEAGDWTYSIVPVSLSENEGTPVISTVNFAAKKNIKPSIDLSLTSKPANADVTGDLTFNNDGVNLFGGYLQIPHQDSMNMGQSMTLSFEFKANDIQGMPVILCHGVWLADGWFVQILNGALIIRSPKGDASGPYIEPGKWYKVSLIYDGMSFYLKVNDKWYDQGSSQIIDVPLARNLIIGQYAAISPQFSFRGTVKNLKIYNDVIAE